MKVELVKMQDILFDAAWNCRSNVEGSGEDDLGNGFAGLKASIAAGAEARKGPPWTGVDQPITIYPYYKGYKCISGHRRSEAVRQLCAEKRMDEIYMPCIIVQSDDLDARAMNLRENIHRKNISHADMCFAIGAIYREHKGISAHRIAKMVGVDESRVGVMLKIFTKVNPNILAHWRASTAMPATIETMRDIAKLPTDQQEQTYKRRAMMRCVKDGRGRRESWTPFFIRLGRLARIKALDVDIRAVVARSMVLWDNGDDNDEDMILAFQKGMRNE